MKNEKFYFENEDSEMCYPLSYHIEKAKEEGLKEIELFEAIPDKTNKDIKWCRELETTVESKECNKSCEYYTAPEKGRICKRRGRLMEWGKSVKFSIMEKESTLSIMDKMVKENNQGIMLSTTITDVKFVKQGAIIGFGVTEEIGNNANTQTLIGTSDYMFMCFAVKKSEFEKYRAAQTGS